MSEPTRADVEGLLNELERLLRGVASLRELSPRSNDLLVSFGERMSVRIVAEELRRRGVSSFLFHNLMPFAPPLHALTCFFAFAFVQPFTLPSGSPNYLGA